MIKKMEIKDINSLADLKAAKKELKFKMAVQDQRTKEGLIYSSVNKLFDQIESTAVTQQSFLGSSVNGTLSFLTQKAGDKFHLSKTTKSVLSLAMLIAVPIITRKLQNYIDDKFND